MIGSDVTRLETGPKWLAPWKVLGGYDMTPPPITPPPCPATTHRAQQRGVSEPLQFLSQVSIPLSMARSLLPAGGLGYPSDDTQSDGY